MKKNNYLSQKDDMPLLKYAILLGLCTMLTSCSKDDSPSSNNVDADISGTYTLTGFNVSPAQDVNEDDTASTNLLDEMDCLSEL